MCRLFLVLLPLSVLSAPPPGGQWDNYCYPPDKVYPSDCGTLDWDPNYSCAGAIFNITSGRWFPCQTHEDCYSHQEPNEWCHLPLGGQWTDKGCFCDQKLGSCIIERQVPEDFQYAYCMRQEDFVCDLITGRCPYTIIPPNIF